MKRTHQRRFGEIGSLLVIICALLLPLLLAHCSDPLAGPTRDPAANNPRLLEKGSASGTLAGGAQFFISVPPGWEGLPNQDIVVYAHGYMAVGEPWTPQYDKVDGKLAAEIVNSLGYAYASTSYRYGGLAVPWAVEDLLLLMNEVKNQIAPTTLDHAYLVGPSEGGLVTTLTLELHPTAFSGGLAMCGPIGDFQKQLNYFGDFRVVFDYFFPGLMPGSFIVPYSTFDAMSDSWGNVYLPRILSAIAKEPGKTAQLLNVTKAAFDPFDMSTVQTTVDDVLWYNFFGSEDAKLKLGGMPFNNVYRWYMGSTNDFLLNQKVERIKAGDAALAEVNAKYQTSGQLSVPLVTMHTLLDQQVPYWHATLYRQKVYASGSSMMHTHIPVPRYGHCQFTEPEVLGAFAVLVLKVTASELVVPQSRLATADAERQLMEIARVGGARPVIAKPNP